MLQQLDPVIDEAAADLGAGFFRTFGRVILPLTAPALVAGMAYMFAACITSISAVIMVVSAHWYLITVELLAAVDLGDLSVAAVYGVLILASVMGSIVLMDVVISRMLLRRK
jgi:iron(III) transport system permease protein